MINYKGNFFFLVPCEFGTNDIEFLVYDCNGYRVGTNFKGIRRATYYSKKEMLELDELVQSYSIELETKMKFFKEFNVDISNWESLNISKELIKVQMDNSWNIAPLVIESYLVN